MSNISEAWEEVPPAMLNCGGGRCGPSMSSSARVETLAHIW